MTSPVPLNYTAREFDALREEFKGIIRDRIPDWVDADGSFEMVLLDAYAYMGDILNFYVDRVAAEAFVQTAVRRDSILRIAQVFGYTPTPQVAARGMVRFTKVQGVGDVIVPAGTQVFSQREGAPPIVFETADLTTISAGAADIEVHEGTTVKEELVGVSTGRASQIMPLFSIGVIKDSVKVYVKDGDIDSQTGIPTLVEWQFVDRLIDVQFFEQAFSTWRDDQGFSYILFGDGVNGQVPAVGAEVYCTYRFGVGEVGNVAAGAIKSLVSGGSLAGKVSNVTNLEPMQGGANAESMASMRRAIPKSLSAVERAVTTEDYRSLALQVGGIGKARCSAVNSINVILYVAPVGGGLPTSLLKEQVQLYLSDKKMLGTTVTVSDPTYVNINVSAEVEASPRFRNVDIQQAVQNAISDLYSFDNVEFAQRISRAELFQALISVTGVVYVNVTEFNRSGLGFSEDFTLDSYEIPQVGSITVIVSGGVISA